MRVEIDEVDGKWRIRSAGGETLPGKTLAKAETVALSGVERRGGKIVGTLTATWGMSFVNDKLDMATRLKLTGRRGFDYRRLKPINMNTFRRADRLIVNGTEFMGV